jgi:hypothetical protein
MTNAEPEVDHRHLGHPAVKGAATHYDNGADESSHENLSMFARAFEKVQSMLFLCAPCYVPSSTSRLAKNECDQIYNNHKNRVCFYRLKISFILALMGL